MAYGDLKSAHEVTGVAPYHDPIFAYVQIIKKDVVLNTV